MATLRPYKLSWLINQVASLKLKLDQAVDGGGDLLGQENHPRPYSLFLFETEHCAFRLVKNGAFSRQGLPVGYLIPQLRQFDFFFTVQDATATFRVEEFCAALRATKQVTYLAPLPEGSWCQTDLLQLLEN